MKQHEEDTVCLQTDMERDKTEMLREFQEAQTLLTDKIATLQLMSVMLSF